MIPNETTIQKFQIKWMAVIINSHTFFSIVRNPYLIVGQKKVPTYTKLIEKRNGLIYDNIIYEKLNVRHINQRQPPKFRLITWDRHI